MPRSQEPHSLIDSAKKSPRVLLIIRITCGYQRVTKAFSSKLVRYLYKCFFVAMSAIKNGPV